MTSALCAHSLSTLQSLHQSHTHNLQSSLLLLTHFPVTFGAEPPWLKRITQTREREREITLSRIFLSHQYTDTLLIYKHKCYLIHTIKCRKSFFCVCWVVLCLWPVPFLSQTHLNVVCVSLRVKQTAANAWPYTVVVHDIATNCYHCSGL